MKKRNIRCRDGFCGAEDCQQCHPENFQGDKFIPCATCTHGIPISHDCPHCQQDLHELVSGPKLDPRRG